MNTKPDDQDPSMDDILASIRRIMLDEQARLKESGPAPQEAERPGAIEEPAPPVLPPVLVLDASMAVHEPAPEPPSAAAESAPEAVIMTALAPLIPDPVLTESVSAEPPPGAPVADEPAVLARKVEGAPVDAAPAEPAPTGPFSQLDAQALEALLAPAAAAAAAASVDAMLRQLQAERESFLQGGTSEGGPSLEQVVRGEIRPMLKAWLDEHLPEMVERLVRAELARLTLRHTS